MAKFYILGRYTDKGLGGFVSNPDTDRKAATTALAEAGGAKLTGYAGLRGKYDFMVEVEVLLIRQLHQEWLQFQVWL